MNNADSIGKYRDKNSFRAILEEIIRRKKTLGIVTRSKKDTKPKINLRLGKSLEDQQKEKRLERIERDKRLQQKEEESKANIIWNELKKLARGWKIEVNNSKGHNLYQRIVSRTVDSDGNPASLAEIKDLFVKIIKELVKRFKDDKILKPTMFEIIPKTKKFKMLIYVNPKNFFIRFSSVLANNMKTSNTEKILIKERKERKERRMSILREVLENDAKFAHSNIDVLGLEVETIEI